MNLSELSKTPAWEWPDGADDFLLDLLRDAKTALPDRIVAAELAGDYVVVNDDIARTLIAIASDRSADDELRCIAAISLGPALEDADMMDPDDPEDSVISEHVFEGLRRGLRKIYMDGDAPESVRRSVLEAAVRAPEDWHREAVRGAYKGGAPEWKLTAVFCMRFVEGFEDEITESLASDDPLILREAVLAAGNWDIRAAWPVVRALMVDPEVDRNLRIAAIEASPGIDPDAAVDLLVELSVSEDEEIAETANEALAICTGAGDDDADFDELDGDDDERP
jgi:uncharacterized protein (UPF0147 family)